MICKACGRNAVNESANYCEYCGTSFRDNMSIRQEDNYIGINNQSNNMSNISVNTVSSENEGNEKPISFGNWFGSMLLPFIPLIGFLIYPVMLLVWAFGSETPKSKKNWARATLLTIVIVIIIFIFMFTSTAMEIMNSGLSFEDYMNQFYQAQ